MVTDLETIPKTKLNFLMNIFHINSLGGASMTWILTVLGKVSLYFEIDDIYQILRNLNPSQAAGRWS